MKYIRPSPIILNYIAQTVVTLNKKMLTVNFAYSYYPYIYFIGINIETGLVNLLLILLL